MLKKLITAALALSVSVTAYAAADPLSQPAPSSRDLTAVQEMTAIVVPNAEVYTALQQFTTLQAQRGGQLVKEVGVGVKSEQGWYNDQVLHYMYVRVNLYRDSHGWKEEAYGKQAVYKLYHDYETFFATHSYVTPENKAMFEQDFLNVLADNTRQVENNELRFYLNETVLFSLQAGMDADRQLISPYEEGRIVNLRQQL